MRVEAVYRYRDLEIDVGEENRIESEGAVRALLVYMGEGNFLNADDGYDSMRCLKGACKIVPREDGIEIDLYVGKIVYNKHSNVLAVMDGVDQRSVIKRFHKVVPYQV